MLCGSYGLFGGLLPAAAAREIFADPASIVAGSLAPTGTARAVAGGYQLSEPIPIHPRKKRVSWERKQWAALVGLLVLVILALTLWPHEPSTPTYDHVNVQVSGWPDGAFDTGRPAPVSGWMLLEVVEHLTLSNLWSGAGHIGQVLTYPIRGPLAGLSGAGLILADGDARAAVCRSDQIVGRKARHPLEYFPHDLLALGQFINERSGALVPPNDRVHDSLPLNEVAEDGRRCAFRSTAPTPAYTARTAASYTPGPTWPQTELRP